MAKPFSIQQRQETLVAYERSLRTARAGLRPEAHAPAKLSEAQAIAAEREREVDKHFAELKRVKAQVERLAPQLDRAKAALTAADDRLRPVEKVIAEREVSLEKATDELQRLAQDPDADLKRAGELMVASRVLAEFLRVGYQQRDKLRSERLAAADHLGRLQNELQGHQRTAEAIAAKAEAAKAQLETARKGVAEWAAVVAKLEQQAVEYTKAIDSLHAAGVSLPPAI